MSLQLEAVKQLLVVLTIMQKNCGVIRNVRECVRREAFPHTHYTVVHVERKSLLSEKPRSKITQCAPGLSRLYTNYTKLSDELHFCEISIYRQISVTFNFCLSKAAMVNLMSHLV